ncbi:hypothetical protein THAOC_05126 [Thalassiosira oceanica]|uniref:Uncharacterized protein n=1 Tax=Thalassiosira oceanica TaxID=159749 RepID=K0T3L6_THAOC|nr:hypothetical protein THAOC_05126 [Thalassiosira oceanica]|eukprot:EJK73258.1 hypothetical protein THAOC_05126 [Thalassiosira oceanica]
MSCPIRRQVPASSEQETRSGDPLPNMDTYNNRKTGRGQGVVTSKGGKIHFKQRRNEAGQAQWTWSAGSTMGPEISGFVPPDKPQDQQVYGTMNPLLAYALAPMHLSAFDIPRGSGETTWETTTSSTSAATPFFRADPRNDRLSALIGGEGQPRSSIY